MALITGCVVLKLELWEDDTEYDVSKSLQWFLKDFLMWNTNRSYLSVQILDVRNSLIFVGSSLADDLLAQAASRFLTDCFPNLIFRLFSIGGHDWGYYS
ncbi:E4 ORFC [Tree shrew adenovirus 1]|uniref:E4 ORFC n=1 Tax=Tree shrew adenovirus serotype 1 TaxID=47680 RepID=A0A2U9AGB2_ADET1|nr:E4 ORFC [Tree shrew adenovirus 1]